MHDNRLSVVCTARNDNHGGDLLHRMRLFVEGLCNQCDRWQLAGELIVVDWNPPGDRPPLAEAISWPVARGGLVIRIITVPAAVHAHLEYADKLPLFQMVAKNVGIRRARERFVLATNIDVLFSDRLVRRMFSGRMRTDRMYRVDRHDCPTSGLLEMPAGKRLEHCRRNTIRINRRDGSLNLQTGHFHVIYPAYTWRSRFHEYCQDHGWHAVTSRCRLHTNACGDFTLMARERWHELHGYAEFKMYSMHLDSLLCHAAHNRGIREVVWGGDCRVYHLEHQQGSGWSPEGEKALNARLDRAGVPQLSHEQFQQWAIGMRRDGGMIFNQSDWGFGNDIFPEHCC